MDGPEDARVPVDSPHVGVVGEEGAEGGPEDGRGHAHQHRGEEDVARVEEEEVRDVEGVGERGEEEGGPRAEPLHQGRRGEAGQREAQVDHHVAATHQLTSGHHLISPTHIRNGSTDNSWPISEAMEL